MDEYAKHCARCFRRVTIAQGNFGCKVQKTKLKLTEINQGLIGSYNRKVLRRNFKHGSVMTLLFLPAILLITLPRMLALSPGWFPSWLQKTKQWQLRLDGFSFMCSEVENIVSQTIM